MSEIRLCENCGHRNAINSLECENCGYDLSFAIPIDESELDDNSSISEQSCPSEECSAVLASVDGQLIIPIRNELVIGRDAENGEYLEKSRFVSRKHAVFYVENGEILIFDASTNGTFVNDRRLPKLMKTPVHAGDRITFADLSFEVRRAD